MPDVQARFGYPGLKISYTCSAAVTGGQLVERVAGSRLVQPAGASSAKVVGVAMHDVPAARASIQGPQVGDGNELTVISGVVILVTFANAAVEGDDLIAAAAGQVTPLAAAATAVAADINNARAIVGYAFEAVAGGATGLAFIKHGGSC